MVLKKLSIKKIEQNTFVGLENLKIIDLNDNLLTSFDSSFASDRFKSVQSLLLEQNEILSITKNTFKDMTSLEKCFLKSKFYFIFTY